MHMQAADVHGFYKPDTVAAHMQQTHTHTSTMWGCSYKRMPSQKAKTPGTAHNDCRNTDNCINGVSSRLV
jgi:hypothetical protein